MQYQNIKLEILEPEREPEFRFEMCGSDPAFALAFTEAEAEDEPATWIA